MQKNFSRIDLCQAFMVTDPPAWFHRQHHVMLDGACCGAEQTNEGEATWHLNPRWRLTLTEETNVVIGISQPSTKWIDGEDAYDIK